MPNFIIVYYAVSSSEVVTTKIKSTFRLTNPLLGQPKHVKFNCDAWCIERQNELWGKLSKAPYTCYEKE